MAVLSAMLVFSFLTDLAMKKMKMIFPGWRGALALLLLLTLSGCQKWLRYTISEQEVNQYLQQQGDYQKETGINGLVTASIHLHHLTSQIGREDPDKIVLQGDADLRLSSPLGEQRTTLKLALKARPAYNRESGAIYLQEMQLTHFEAQSDTLQTLLQGLEPWLNTSLAAWFDTHPVYQLDSAKSHKAALVKKLAQGLIVQPGELVIPLSVTGS